MTQDVELAGGNRIAVAVPDLTAGQLVRIDEAVVGRLWLDLEKRFCFQYDKNWLEQSRIPLSLSLPLHHDSYLDESHPFSPTCFLKRKCERLSPAI